MVRARNQFIHKFLEKHHTRIKGELKMKKFGLLICILLLLVGCSNDQPQVSIYHVDDDQEEIESLKEIFQDNEKISEAAAVFFDHQLVVSLQVEPLSKFSKEKIAKSIEKEVKSVFPDHDVFVSPDLKITWELKKIIEKKPTEDALKKDLDKLRALAKEKT